MIMKNHLRFVFRHFAVNYARNFASAPTVLVSDGKLFFFQKLRIKTNALNFLLVRPLLYSHVSALTDGK